MTKSQLFASFCDVLEGTGNERPLRILGDAGSFDT